jgi:hypothetical protein
MLKQISAIRPSGQHFMYLVLYQQIQIHEASKLKLLHLSNFWFEIDPAQTKDIKIAHCLVQRIP